MGDDLFRTGPKSPWGWQPARQEGIWKYGAAWARPFVAAAPWVTVALLLVLFALVGGRMVAAPGVVFDLPRSSIQEGEVTSLVALMIPVPRDVAGGEETLVFFDDARYTLSDPSSSAALAARLEQRAAARRGGALLLLADRHVPCGELMRFVELARASGVARVQVAEKRE